MSRSRKYHLPPPERMTVPPSPAEIIEHQPKGGPRPGKRVQLVPVGPPPEIIEASPVPRVQLVIVLRVGPGIDPARLILSVGRFLTAIQEKDRKLHLKLDPARSSTAKSEATLVLVPEVHRLETAERLEKVAAAVPEAIKAFDGVALKRVEVVQRT
jgi:hypothetical protein